METYTECKEFVDHPDFRKDRQIALDKLEIGDVDPPLLPIVQKINRLPHVFSLQCCHGHFLWENGHEIRSVDPLETDKWVEYRLAYIAVCIENSSAGRQFQQRLLIIPSLVDQRNSQLCSANWFWDQWPNSYALQIMPERYKAFDSARITYLEATQLAKIRDAFFACLDDVLTIISTHTSSELQ